MVRYWIVFWMLLKVIGGEYRGVIWLFWLFVESILEGVKEEVRLRGGFVVV